MMKWRPFTYQGIHYTLSHLHPFEWAFVLPAKGNQLERHYSFDVAFSLHTFTKGIKNRTATDEALIYSDSREQREFDFNRYALSKRLPEIVHSLNTRKCYCTGHGNFFTVDIIEENGAKKRYEIYFETFARDLTLLKKTLDNA